MSRFGVPWRERRWEYCCQPTAAHDHRVPPRSQLMVAMARGGHRSVGAERYAFAVQCPEDTFTRTLIQLDFRPLRALEASCDWNARLNRHYLVAASVGVDEAEKEE